MTKIIQATIFTLLTLVATLDGFTVAHAGTITVFQRESSGENVLLAGAGGALEQLDINDQLATLTGLFSFSDSSTIDVAESDPFSTGAAEASGAISITDSVVQPTLSSLVLSATRSASATAEAISGTGPTAASTQGQIFRVRFTVGNDPVQYSLTGSFDPGATTGTVGEVGRISLHRPFTAIVPIEITTATAAINETGTLAPNLAYEFLVRMTDKTRASFTSGILSASDASSLNVVLTLQSIPEPSSALLALVGLAAFTRWRSRC